MFYKMCNWYALICLYLEDFWMWHMHTFKTKVGYYSWQCLFIYAEVLIEDISMILKFTQLKIQCIYMALSAMVLQCNLYQVECWWKIDITIHMIQTFAFINHLMLLLLIAENEASSMPFRYTESTMIIFITHFKDDTE